MRQIHVQVREEHKQRVLELANEHDAFSPTAVQAERANGERWTMVFLNLPNDRVGRFVQAVDDQVDDAQWVVYPQGTLPLQPPLQEVRQRVHQVAHRSTLELVVSSLQSVGSWKGLLLYALFSGVVAAYGVIFNSSFLLVAAMLIAPMGAPVMVSVIGVSIGDWRMFGRGLGRFAVAIVVLVLSALVLGYLYGLGFSTAIMEQITSLSVLSVLIALVAGAAGAQSQVQSERASLVTGTATGFLIAAALSPTAAVLGLAIPLQRWDYVALMAFQLSLQYVAIVFGGWLSLLLYDVAPGDASVGRGSQWVRAALAAVLLAASAGLVWWQLQHTPRYRKADMSRRAIEVARQSVQTVPGVQVLEVDAHFTRPDLPDRQQEALLVNITVHRTAAATLPDPQLQSVLRLSAQRRLQDQIPGVVPFVGVNVMRGPE